MKNTISDNLLIDIISQLAYILINDKYLMWKEYTKILLEKYSSLEILKIWGSIDANDYKTYYKDFLILIGKEKKNYKIYCE